MSDHAGQPHSAENSGSSAIAPALSDVESAPRALPTLLTPLPADETIARAQALSKAGRLPGFEAEGARAFRTAVFGTVYDRTLHARVEARDAGAGSVVTLHTTLNRKMPIGIVVGLAIAIWPGVLLTHSLLATYFGFYPRSEWVTWAWYLPLTVLAIPVLIKQYRASEAAAAEHATEIAERLRVAMDATAAPHAS